MVQRVVYLKSSGSKQELKKKIKTIKTTLKIKTKIYSGRHNIERKKQEGAVGIGKKYKIKNSKIRGKAEADTR